MITYRIIATHAGKEIVGPWIKDVPYYLIEACKIWVGREIDFKVEFKQGE